MDDDFKLDEETSEKEFKVEEKKKEKKKINIDPKIIMIVLGFLCFIFLILFINKSSQVTKLTKRLNDLNNAPEPDTIEVLDITDSEVRDLFNIATTTIGNYCRREGAYFTDSKNTISNLSDEVVYGIVMNKLVYVDKIGGNITKRTVHNEVSKLFGENYRFEDKTFTTYPLYKYNEESATYVPDKNGKAFSTAACDLYKIVKAYKEGDELYIYVKVLFAKADRDGIKYYSDYRRSNEITNLQRNSSGALLGNDYNYSKGGLFEMKFTLDENNNYVFEHSQPTR